MSSIPLPALHINPPADPSEGLTKAVQLKSLLQSQQLQQQAMQENQLQIDQQKRSQADHQLAQKTLADNNGDMDKTLNQLRGKVDPSFQAQLEQEHALTLQRESVKDARDRALEEKTNGDLFSVVDQAKGMSAQDFEKNKPLIAQRISEINPKIQMPPDAKQSDMDNLLLGLNVQKYYQQKAKQKQDEQAAQDVHQNIQSEIEARKNKPENKDDRAISIMAKPEKEWTPAEAAYMKGYRQYVKETKVEPGVLRIEALGETRGPTVFDNQANATVTMNWNDYNRLNKQFPGRYTAPQFTPESQIQQGTGKAFAPGGKGSEDILAFNTAIKHANTLQKAADALDNGDIRLANKIGNEVGIQFGSDKATNFRTIAGVYTREVNKALTSNHITDQELEKIGGTMPDNASPAQIKGSLNAYKSLMADKAALRQQQFEAGRQGKPNFNTPSAQPSGKTIRYKIVNGQLVPE